MNKLECLELGAFNELINLSFIEVREVFNFYAYYVPNSRSSEFIQESSQIKNWYDEELKKIEEYAQNEYTQSINLGIEVPEYNTPEFKAQEVEIQTQRKLIRLISKYFDKEVFKQNKAELYTYRTFKEEVIEKPHELFISLNLHRDKIYSLLSILGYYQRRHGYFLSSSDYYKMCKEYSHQVYQINKNLGMKFRFVDIFLSNSRLKPSKNRGEDDPSEYYQSNKFIDIDKISLLMLVQPYLKYNTQEITKIIEIMTRNLRGRFGGLAWDKVIDEVKQFISECESRGIMKKVK